MDLFLDEIAVPGSDAVVVDCKAFVRSLVEELDLVGSVHSNGVSNERFSTLNIPDNERVVILTPQGGEVLLVGGETETLDEYFVQLKSMHHLKSVEIPNNDVSLEAHVSLLTRCNVLSSLSNFNNRDIVVVASEELLGPRNNVSNHQSCSKGIDNVLVVRM